MGKQLSSPDSVVTRWGAYRAQSTENITMKTLIALCIIGLLSASLVGCTTTGIVYQDSRVAMIKKDVTTEAELLDWFGPATTRSLVSDGSKMLTWKFTPKNFGSSGRLQVQLGANGKVMSYSGSAGPK